MGGVTPAVALALYALAGGLLVLGMGITVAVLDRDTTTRVPLAAWVATYLVLAIGLAHVLRLAIASLIGA